MARDGYISLVPAKTHRKGRMVRIPIHSSIAKLFSRNGQLFPYLSSRYAKDRGSLSREFRAILDDAGIPKDGTGFHSLRATFITSLEQAGVDRSLVQGMVGHTSPMQTAHYSRVVATQAQIERLQV
jgi:integrase